MKIPTHNFWFIALAATITSICWGGNFSAGKFALMHFPAVEATILRFIIVTLLLLPFALRSKPMYWRDALALSVLFISLHFVFMFQALHLGISVSTLIIISQMGVPFSCILAAFLFKDYLGKWRSLGLLVSFSGLILIAGTPSVTHVWSAFLVALLAAFFWASANSYMKIMRPASVVSCLFWPGIYALPQLMLISFFTGDTDYVSLLETAPTSAWAGVAYSAIASSVLGYGIWMWLLQRHAISKIVPYSLTMPIFGLLIAQIFFPEPLSFAHYAGIVLTLIGVSIITIRRPKLVKIEKA
jgi:O-acetylserine/cysteine efflux transporter